MESVHKALALLLNACLMHLMRDADLMLNCPAILAVMILDHPCAVF